MNDLDKLLKSKTQEGHAGVMLLHAIKTGVELYFSAGGATRVLVTPLHVQDYLSYLVYPTVNEGIYLLATKENNIVGVLEDEEHAKIKDMEVSIDLSFFANTAISLQPRINFFNITCLNSLVLKGSLLAEEVKIDSLAQCHNLFKIISENCRVIINEGACSGLHSLYYLKGEFILVGGSNFRGCGNLNNVNKIINVYLPRDAFNGCSHLKSLKLEKGFSSIEQDNIFETNALSGCDSLNFNYHIDSDYLICLNQSGFNTDKITVGNLIEPLKQMPNKTKLF